MRANIRKHVDELLRELDLLQSPAGSVAPDVEALRAHSRGVIRQIDASLGRFRDMRVDFEQASVPTITRETYECVDEYLSIELETYLTLVLEHIDAEKELRSKFLQIRTDIVEHLVIERSHRENSGYGTVLGKSASKEHYVYRRGLLKKIVMSVLFLEIVKEKEGRRWADFGAAVAAGVAMLFASIAAIYAQISYGMNTLPFVLALVVSYIAKDRIKDWLKLYFSRKMTRWLSDYSVLIEDPAHDTNIGRCREGFSCIDRAQVPRFVYEIRHKDASSLIDKHSKPEVVFKYEKDVRLKAARIGALHGRLADINDIIRFNVSSFLNRTDDPVRALRTYDEENDQVVDVNAPKVYHLNVIFVLRAYDGDQRHTSRIRVVLDKRGIQRLEEV
jgi:hypothetical protein